MDDTRNDSSNRTSIHIRNIRDGIAGNGGVDARQELNSLSRSVCTRLAGNCTARDQIGDRIVVDRTGRGSTR